MTSDPLPLTGIRVVEFGHMVMGPTCGLVLGDLGADVVKVEPVPDGDNTRRLTGSGAGYFTTYNRNKKSIALDVRAAAGAEVARRLIAGADVMTENFRPGAMIRLGLDYAALTPDYPSLIYCSLKGFLSGPYEHRKALDEVVQMMAGLAYMTGPPGQPLRAGASINDVMGGMFAAIGVLAALHQRRATGRGQLVKSSLFENNAFLVGQHMAQYAVTGRPAEPMSVRLSAWAIYDVFATKDGEQLFVGVVTDTQWRLFCQNFGLEELLADETLSDNPSRVSQRPRLMPIVRDLFGRYTRAELIDLCEKSELPFAPITKPEELFEDPHLNAGDGLIEVSLPGGGSTRVPALPLEMGGHRLGARLDVPRAGQHTRAVLEELGYSSPEVAALAERGVIVCGDD